MAGGAGDLLVEVEPRPEKRQRHQIGDQIGAPADTEPVGDRGGGVWNQDGDGGGDPEECPQNPPHPVALAPQQAERAAETEAERDREGDELEECHRWSLSMRTCAAMRTLSLERCPLARL